jgi:hypothetical protein
MIVLLAVLALTVTTAFAGGADDLLGDHAPVCYRVESFVGTGYFELRCDDAGKDIINVTVKTMSKYEVNWDSDFAVIRVYPADRHASAFWTVVDKAGNIVSGRLP